MQSVRVIPCLDVKEGRVVKGTSFVDLRDAGDPVELGARYDRLGADELVFLDIAASNEGRRTLIGLVERVAREVFIPFTVGGGVGAAADVGELLHAGADKVSVNTQALHKPSLIEEIASTFGSQCCVVAIDVKRVDGGFAVFTHGGSRPTGVELGRWLDEVQDRGAGEILITSMDRDGTKRGYDVELLEMVMARTAVPIVASGGVGAVEHFVEAAATGASGLLAASVFHYQEIGIGEVKDRLRADGYAVRPAGLEER